MGKLGRNKLSSGGVDPYIAAVNCWPLLDHAERTSVPFVTFNRIDASDRDFGSGIVGTLLVVRFIGGNMASDVRISAVEKTVDVVRTLDALDGATATQVAEELDVPISTAHDYLQSLETVGMVTRINQMYQPSLRFLKYGEAQKRRIDEFVKGEEVMQDLAAKTDEHISLIVEERGRCVLVHVEEGENSVSFRSYPGIEMYMHATAPGKAMLAAMRDEEVAAVLDRYGLPQMTPNTITDRETLLTEIEEIRETGVATDTSELIEDLYCVGAPIHNRQSDRISALSICIPTARAKEESYRQEIQNAVMEFANIIQVNVNYS